jgi:hypothetical protein
MLKVALLFRRSGNRSVVVTNVPYYFRSTQPQVRDDARRIAQPRRLRTVGLLFAGLIITTGGLLAGVDRGWPPVVEHTLGLGAIGFVAALFFSLLLRSMTR